MATGISQAINGITSWLITLAIPLCGLGLVLVAIYYIVSIMNEDDRNATNARRAFLCLVVGMGLMIFGPQIAGELGTLFQTAVPTGVPTPVP